MAPSTWRAVILAAGRGADDPMAKAFGVAHKCTIPVAGVPMLARVVRALQATRIAPPFAVSIDSAGAARAALGQAIGLIEIMPSASSAPASAIAAVEKIGTYPVLITTGDHALLNSAMVEHMLAASEASGADVLAGLATSEVINASYPETKRTYFNLGGTHVSGCNLFAVMTPRGLRLLEAWQHLEKNRKKPWKLVAAFGLAPLFYFLAGKLTPARAFGLVSRKLAIAAAPVFLPFAEAAIDVDKPSDHALAEKILLGRSSPG